MSSEITETMKVRKRYDRFSTFYDVSETMMEGNFFRKWRRDLLTGVNGRVLEIGVGTGKNLPYYPKDIHLIAIDISPKMMAKAKKKAEKLDLNVDFTIMDAQHLEYDDDQFDYIIITFVLCSVPDPISSLKEMIRVLKPTGKILTLDHVLSKNQLIAIWENFHNPLTLRLFSVNVNRDTLDNIHRSGLNVESDEKLAIYDVFRKFVCTIN